MIYRDSKGRFCKAPIKGYKGFESGLICLGKQYKVGEVFTEPEAIPCERGIHFCKNPLHVLKFYPPISNTGIPNEYAEVEVLEESITDDNIKFCTTKLKVVRKLSLDELIQAGIEYTLKHSQNVKESTDAYSAVANTGVYSAASNIGYCGAVVNAGDYSTASNTGNYNAVTNTGDCSTASNTGYCSAASSTGYRSVVINTGYYSAASNTGEHSTATNTGNYSSVTNTGDYSIASNTGFCSIASNTGVRSAVTNTGDYSTASVSGKHSVAVNTGYKGKVKGALGCWIACAEHDSKGNVIDMQIKKVDGKDIKADTWYRLENGKFVEI